MYCHVCNPFVTFFGRRWTPGFCNSIQRVFLLMTTSRRSTCAADVTSFDMQLNLLRLNIVFDKKIALVWYEAKVFAAITFLSLQATSVRKTRLTRTVDARSSWSIRTGERLSSARWEPCECLTPTGRDECLVLQQLSVHERDLRITRGRCL